MFFYVRHFLTIALFDRYLSAGFQRKIQRRNRSSDVKWNVVLPGEYGDHIGSDLIRRVSVGCNSIRADDEPHSPCRSSLRAQPCCR